MLRVLVQVTHQQAMATIICLDIQNDGTGTTEIGNYNIELVEYDRRGAKKVRLEGHIRQEGALQLIKKAIEELEYAPRHEENPRQG